MADPIALAVPFFFVLIGGEAVVAHVKKRKLYRLNDALTDLSCGITSQVSVVFFAAAQIAIYVWVWEHWRLITFSSAWAPWLVAFFAVDFLYYWWHRLSHEVNVLWAAHVVHHQSEDYNLAVALRQSAITSWTTLPFYLPCAILGIPVVVFATVLALSTLYQFWIHTELIGKARGPVDWILNLPSHHRVHHAINEPYLDKNYGATLVVWDRLFGTYAEEIEQPVYGITKPLGTFDPMWAQIHYWFEMAAMARAAERPFDKIKVWFASPAWKPKGFTAYVAPALADRKKFDPPLSRGTAIWILLNYVFIVGATFSVMMWKATIPHDVLVLVSLAILAAVFATGAVLERRRWAIGAELGRVILGVAALVVWLRG